MYSIFHLTTIYILFFFVFVLVLVRSILSLLTTTYYCYFSSRLGKLKSCCLHKCPMGSLSLSLSFTFSLTLSKMVTSTAFDKWTMATVRTWHMYEYGQCHVCNARKRCVCFMLLLRLLLSTSPSSRSVCVFSFFLSSSYFCFSCVFWASV